MKKRVLAMTLMMLVLASGCATPSRGRITIINWDSRKAEELKEAKYIEGVVYGNKLNETEAKEEIREDAGTRVFPWAVFVQQLFSFNGKIQFFDLQWDTTTNACTECVNCIEQKKPKISFKPVVIEKVKEGSAE